jgi:hypothetical protein
MAVAITLATSNIGITTNTAIYSMQAFAPTANALLVAIAHASGTVTGSLTGTGATFTQIASQNAQGLGNSVCMYEMDVSASPSSLYPVFDFGGDPAGGLCATMLKITGQEVGYAPRQVLNVTSVGPNPVVTFAPAVNSGNAVVVGIPLPGALATFTPPAGWTTIVSTYGTPTTGLGVFYANAVTGTTFTFSTGAQADLGYVAAEYYYSGGAPVVIVPPGGMVDAMGMSGFFGA